MARHCSPAGCRTGASGRAGRPGIGFNAHCYQRREDATQPHCLAGLVTAGDIINRLRTPSTVLFVVLLPLHAIPSRTRRTIAGRRRVETLYFVSENITVSWLRWICLSSFIELAENRIFSSYTITVARATRVQLRIYQKNEFAQEAALNLQDTGGEITVANKILPRL